MMKVLLVVFCVLFLVSAGFNYNGSAKVRRINDEVSTAAVAFEPTHRCEANGLELYCFRVTGTLKTCYTLPDNKGGKRCLTEPFWQEFVPEDGCPIEDCKDIHDRCPDEIKEECLTSDYCPEPVKCPTNPVCPLCTTCIQTCDGCGSGGSCPSCPSCPACIDALADCPLILAKTDVGNFMCGGETQTCVNQDDLSQSQLDELGWC